MISTRACKWDQFWKIMKVLRLGVQHAKYNLKILHRTVTKLFHTELFWLLSCGGLWYLEIQGSKNGQSFLRCYQIVRRSGCGFWSFKTSSLIFLPYGKYSSREDVLLLYRLSRLLKLNKLTFMTFYETIRNRTCSITRSYRLSCR